MESALRNGTGLNSQPPRWRLPASYQELLRKALADRSGTSVTAEQRAALRHICSAPERASFAPEDFLIAFKLALGDAANDVRIPLGPERNDLLSRLVSAYIEEFYRFPRDGSPAKHADGQEHAAPGR
jgi:hypothetical protein